MDRVYVQPQVNESGYEIDDLGGWFDRDKATCYDEDTLRDGNSHRGRPGGSETGHQQLYRTAAGHWVLRNDLRDDRNGGDVYRFVTPDEALAWMVRAGVAEDDIIEAFPQVPEERGPGVLRVGCIRNVTLSDDDWAAVGQAADVLRISRSEVVRCAVRAWLDGSLGWGRHATRAPNPRA